MRFSLNESNFTRFAPQVTTLYRSQISVILRFCIVCSLLQPDLPVLSMLEYVDGNLTIILWLPVTLLWRSNPGSWSRYCGSPPGVMVTLLWLSTRGQGHATVALHPGSWSRYCGSPPGVMVTLLWRSTRGQGHATVALHPGSRSRYCGTPPGVKVTLLWLLHPGSRSRYCGAPPGVKVTLLWHSTRGQGHATVATPPEAKVMLLWHSALGLGYVSRIQWQSPFTAGLEETQSALAT